MDHEYLLSESKKAGRNAYISSRRLAEQLYKRNANFRRANIESPCTEKESNSERHIADDNGKWQSPGETSANSDCLTEDPVVRNDRTEAHEGDGDFLNLDEIIQFSQSSTPPPFGYEDALNSIAAIFSYNNISNNLGQDIFLISEILQKYPTITLREVQRKVGSWSDHRSRVYTYCELCEQLLTEEKKCSNSDCRRYLVSQANLSGGKQIITFSIRDQIQDLLDNGVFDSSLLTRTKEDPSLSCRLSRTPNYIQKLVECEAEHPDKLTLLVSVSTDGFQKKGMCRGDIWPMFVVCHDVSVGSGKFREYQADVSCLAAILHSTKKLSYRDFSSAFARVKIEIEESESKPLSVSFDKREYKVVLRIYQTCLDMDASRKIHGLPNWLSYNSCSRCDIEGERVQTRNNGNTICWFSAGTVNLYSDNNPPQNMHRTSFPPPYHDGFDALHLMFEGTSKDILVDLLKTGKKLGAKLDRATRNKWADALNSVEVCKGMSTKILLTPLQLSCRTGSEIQKIYDLSLPVLILCTQSGEKWPVAVYLLWLVTRVVTDCHLKRTHCADVRLVGKDLRFLLGHFFKELYSMKMHFILDHMLPTLHIMGSPLLSSAAPFERMNQTLGRHTSIFTTKTLGSMTSRFLAIQKSTFLCRSAFGKDQCPFNSPKTVPNRFDDPSDCEPYRVIPDTMALSSYEQLYMMMSKRKYTQMRCTVRVNSKVFSTRRQCAHLAAKNCYVYFFDGQGNTHYGCLERIFQMDDGSTIALLQKFRTADPFGKVRQKCNDFIPSFSAAPCRTLNTYFVEVLGCEFFLLNIYHLQGFVCILEFDGRTFVSRL